MTAIDPKRPCRKRQRARSLGICSMHDDRCYVAELYLILYIFQCFRGSACERYNILERARSFNSINERTV